MGAGSMAGPCGEQSGRWLAGIVLAAAAVALWPEPAARLLTPASDWFVKGHPEQSVMLGGLHHAGHFLRDSVRLNSDTRFWRVWTPSSGDLPLALTSPPFRAPPVLSIPVTGNSSGTGGPAAIWIRVGLRHAAHRGGERGGEHGHGALGAELSLLAGDMVD